jgi:acyl-CoA thioesterase I
MPALALTKYKLNNMRFSWFIFCFFVYTIAPLHAFACPDRSGLVDLNCDGRVVILTFGDSITRGVGDSARLGYPGRLRRIFPEAIIINAGDPGEKTSVGRRRLLSVLAAHPNADYSILLEGVNDFFASRKNVRTTASNLKTMVRSSRSYGILTMLSTLTDTKRRTRQKSWILSVNSRIADTRNMDFFSLGQGIISSDLLHPNNSGYQVMAEYASSILLNAGLGNRPLDTDGDGIYDFAESRFGANSLNSDSDGDGINDGVEVFTYGSNPNNTNSDGDQFSDDFEVNTLHSNPADPRPGAPTITSATVM